MYSSAPASMSIPRQPGVKARLLEAGADLIVLGDITHVAPHRAGKRMYQLAQIAPAGPGRRDERVGGRRGVHGTIGRLEV